MWTKMQMERRRARGAEALARDLTDLTVQGGRQVLEPRKMRGRLARLGAGLFPRQRPRSDREYTEERRVSAEKSPGARRTSEKREKAERGTAPPERERCELRAGSISRRGRKVALGRSWENARLAPRATRRPWQSAALQSERGALQRLGPVPLVLGLLPPPPTGPHRVPRPLRPESPLESLQSARRRLHRPKRLRLRRRC